jgi:hypothetical protein
MVGGPIMSVDQVAVVERDLDDAMRRYSEEFGTGPLGAYTFTPDWVREMTFRGRERPYSMKLALAQLGETMYELIESWMARIPTRSSSAHTARACTTSAYRAGRRSNAKRPERGDELRTTGSHAR